MANHYYHSVRLREDKCIGCVTCVTYCPTDAIRVRDGKAIILENRCIDCGECIRRCPSHAKYAVADVFEETEKYKYNIVLAPPSLYAQFGLDVSNGDIQEGLLSIGFDEVFDVALASEYVSNEIEKYVRNYQGGRKPLISSACPAVLRLIQVRFPELINQVVPVLAPGEAAGIYVKNVACEKFGFKSSDVGVWFVSPCAAKTTNIHQSVDVKATAISGTLSVAEIFGKLCRSFKNKNTCRNADKITTGSSYGMGWGHAGGEIRATGLENSLVVSGIDEVISVLEQISMNKLQGVDYVECLSCPSGCVGGPLTAVNNFVGENNLKQRIRKMTDNEDGLRKEVLKKSMNLTGFPNSKTYLKQLKARPMMQLDENIEEAMKKLEKVDEVLFRLPGIDCKACGAPSCQALAEDIVNGNAHEADCIYVLRESVQNLANGMIELASQIPISGGRLLKCKEEKK